MNAAKSSLTLYVPGLFAPLPEAEAGLRLPALETLIARSEIQSAEGEDYATALCALFGLRGNELPLAALALRGEGGMPGEAHWLRADPVQLVADRDRLYLSPPGTLQLSLEEARGLIADLNAHLAQDELQLLALDGHRWYLRLSEPAGFVTTSLDRAIGHHIDGLLPQGEGAGRWHALLTELQMLLHQSSANDALARRGHAVNSLWLWGAGRLPDKVNHPFSAIFADEPVARGLAYVGSVEPGPRPQGFSDYLSHHRAGALVVWERLRDARLAGDEQARLALLAEFERDWAAPLLAALKGGKLQSLRLLSDDGRAWHIGRGGLRRFWIRRKGLFHA